MRTCSNAGEWAALARRRPARNGADVRVTVKAAIISVIIVIIRRPVGSRSDNSLLTVPSRQSRNRLSSANIGKISAYHAAVTLAVIIHSRAAAPGRINNVVSNINNRWPDVNKVDAGKGAAELSIPAGAAVGMFPHQLRLMPSRKCCTKVGRRQRKRHDKSKLTKAGSEIASGNISATGHGIAQNPHQVVTGICYLAPIVPELRRQHHARWSARRYEIAP